jgi:predicted permease
MFSFAVMTFLGIIGNFAFGGHLPEVIDGFLNSLGDAFSASALFLLGVNMVCNNCNKNQVQILNLNFKNKHF